MGSFQPTLLTSAMTAPAYNPVTGEVVINRTQYVIKAGVLSRGRTEDRWSWRISRAEALDPPWHWWLSVPADH